MPSTKTFYALSELSINEQKAYIQKNPAQFEPDVFWYCDTIDTFKECLEMIGFYNVSVYFSGFGSQGDGAQFEGDYSYQKGALKKVKKEYPEFEELHELAENLQLLERQDFYKINFTISANGRYSHEFDTTFHFEHDDHGYYDNTEKEALYVNACRDFMRTIYTHLENEYNGLESEDYILESIACEHFRSIEVEESQRKELTA